MEKVKQIASALFILMASALILIIGNFIDLHKPHENH